MFHQYRDIFLQQVLGCHEVSLWYFRTLHFGFGSLKLGYRPNGLLYTLTHRVKVIRTHFYVGPKTFALYSYHHESACQHVIIYLSRTDARPQGRQTDAPRGRFVPEEERLHSFASADYLELSTTCIRRESQGASI